MSTHLSSPLIIIQHRPAYLLTINHSASKTFSSFIIKYHQSTSIIFLSSTSIVFVDYSLLLFFWATPSSSFFLSSRPTFKRKLIAILVAMCFCGDRTFNEGEET
jgi:hypothetical protein